MGEIRQLRSSDGKRENDLCRKLGVNPSNVIAGSLVLEPAGSGDWFVRWVGFAVLDAETAAEMFASGDM